MELTGALRSQTASSAPAGAHRGNPDAHQGAQPWWQSAVIYEVYPRSFQDSNGDGVGDLPGLRVRLSYLAHTLGVDALWICPFYPSPMVDFGYDVADFTDVDPVFGNLSDFDELITEAHRLGLRIIIDYIPNHSSDQHPWFAESRSSRDNAKRDWYVWADPGPDGGPPSNWTSEMGGSVWEFEQVTGQYYLHSFHPQQPDLNWRNPDLRAAMLDVVRFWLARGVDGIRIDVAHMIAKDPDLRDNPSRAAPAKNPTDRQHEDFDTQQHVFDRLHPDVHGYLQSIRAVLDDFTRSSGAERVSIAEIEVMPWPQWARFFGATSDGIHLPFNFQMIEAPWTAQAIGASIAAQEGALPPGSWPNYVLQNHDRPRFSTRTGESNVRLAAMLLLTVRGTPTLYYGEELGLPDRVVDQDRWLDPLGRDESRAPMPWDLTPNGGFTTAQPWVPAYEDLGSVSVAAQLQDSASVLRLYMSLLRLRRAHPALRGGRHVPLVSTSPDCLLYAREADGEQLVVALNFADEPRDVYLPRCGHVLLFTHSGLEAPTGTDVVRLPARGGAVILLEPEQRSTAPSPAPPKEEHMIGNRVWAIGDGWIPPHSNGPEPDMTSHDSACMLNAGDQEAHVQLRVYFVDREPAGPYELTIPARRAKHIRFNDLTDPEPLPVGVDYSTVIESDVPIVVQHTRLDSRQAANALMTTIAFPGS